MQHPIGRSKVMRGLHVSDAMKGSKFYLDGRRISPERLRDYAMRCDTTHLPIEVKHGKVYRRWTLTTHPLL